jgi:molecular chaperone Hsp33
LNNDNRILPFQLDASLLRGRGARLGSELDDILSAHDYPYPVAHMVAETVCLAVLLSSMLKYEGIFTLQARGDGPVSMIVADITSEGHIRGCAQYDAERMEVSRAAVAALETPESSRNHLAQYLGKGYIAFTVDQAGREERYQGVVELKGASLVDCVQHYFIQSEQIVTGIKMAAGLRDGKWRAGGIMLQNMPENDGRGEDVRSNVREDDWRRAMLLLDSCTDDEFLALHLNVEDLLYRLFHEEQVRIYEDLPLQKKCRCSFERVRYIVETMSEEDRDYLVQDGKIEVRCDFCSSEYFLDPKTLARIEV